MSTLFRAELDNLQRLVARHAAEQTANTNERERSRLQINTEARAEHARNLGRRASVANRKIVLAWMKKFGRKEKPVSANKVSEGTGLAYGTTRLHLRNMANTGEVIALRAPSGFTRYYMEVK